MSGKPKKDNTMKRLLAFFTMTMALVFTPSARADLLDGLVGYWPFDGDAKDYSGNGNHGTPHGVSLTSDRNGNSGKAYQFGEGKYVSVPSNSQLDAIDDFTLCAWIKIDDWFYHDTYITKWAPIASKGTAAESSRQFGLELGWKTNFFFEVSTFNAHFFDGEFPVKSWIHVAVVRDGHTEILFVNGNKMTPTAISASLIKNSGGLNFGRDPPGSTEWFLGSMDNITLYNRALSSSEISMLYNDNDWLEVHTVSFDANGGTGSMGGAKGALWYTLGSSRY